MITNEHVKMYQLEKNYWWFVGRRHLVSWLLHRHGSIGASTLLFDLGCGTGQNLLSFGQYCRVIGSDYSILALDFCRERGISNIFCGKAEEIALASDSVDIVSALDVLEHVREDVKAMSEVFRVLKPGGAFIVLVPAYGFLWSEHDEALHHFRRYVARELRAKLVASGFALERVSYYITSLFFPILLFRLWQGLTRTSLYPAVSYRIPSKWMNSIFVALLRIERLFLDWINLPFGVSLLAVARKPSFDNSTH